MATTSSQCTCPRYYWQDGLGCAETFSPRPVADDVTLLFAAWYLVAQAQKCIPLKVGSDLWKEQTLKHQRQSSFLTSCLLFLCRCLALSFCGCGLLGLFSFRSIVGPLLRPFPILIIMLVV